jgi:hypothetical protein
MADYSGYTLYNPKSNGEIYAGRNYNDEIPKEN